MDGTVAGHVVTVISERAGVVAAVAAEVVAAEGVVVASLAGPLTSRDQKAAAMRPFWQVVLQRKRPQRCCVWRIALKPPLQLGLQPRAMGI